MALMKEVINQVIYKLFGFEKYNSLKLKNAENGYPWAEDELYCEWINFQDEIQKKKQMNSQKINNLQ